MLKFLLFCFLVYLAGLILMRLFAKSILRFALKKYFQKQMQKSFDHREREHNPYDTGFEKKIVVDQEIEILVPYSHDQTKRDAKEIKYVDSDTE